MDKNYTFEMFDKDLDDGYKIIFTYLKNKYELYKVSDDVYMQELLETHSRNPVTPKQMVTHKYIKLYFKYFENLEYKQEI